MKNKIKVKKSHIHGKGVFAKRRIRRNALVGIYEGNTVRKNDIYVLWVEDDNGKAFGIEGSNELRFLNHSRKANAIFYGDKLFALRNITPGAEITFDYGDEWADVE